MELRQRKWFHDELKNKLVLDTGTRDGVLIDVKPGIRKEFNGIGEKPSLTFTFLIPRQSTSLNDVYVSRTVTASRAERSSCMSLIRQLAGYKAISPEIISDSDKLQALITSLIGNRYKLTTEPSKCGRFNNLLKADALMI